LNAPVRKYASNYKVRKIYGTLTSGKTFSNIAGISDAGKYLWA
jgi:hypothetical protein